MTSADTTITHDPDPVPDEATPRYLGGAAHLAAWGFVFLILRIFAVSGYDWDTAFAVSTTLGLDDGIPLMFGSLMSGHLLTSILLMVVVPLLIAARLWGPSEHRPGTVLLMTVGLVILLALTVSFRSWWLPPATGVVLAALALIKRLPRHNRLRHMSLKVLARAGWLAGVAVLVVAAFVATPWVPHEVITTADDTVAGYVLSVDSGYLNVLTDQHEFVILLTGDVRSRR